MLLLTPNEAAAAWQGASIPPPPMPYLSSKNRKLNSY